MTIDYDALDERFKHHEADEDAQSRHQAIYAAGRAMTVAVLQVTGPGREQSLALTKIEEAVMWANKSVATEG